MTEAAIMRWSDSLNGAHNSLFVNLLPWNLRLDSLADRFRFTGG
jgi:hypothetical protein